MNSNLCLLSSVVVVMQAPPTKPTSVAAMNTTMTTVVLYVDEKISNDGMDEAVVPIAFVVSFSFRRPRTFGLEKQELTFAYEQII